MPFFFTQTKMFMPNRTFPASIPILFRQVRLMLEYKQEVFAELLKISQSKLSKIENGRLRPDSTLLNRLREVVITYKPEINDHFLKQINIREWLTREIG